MFHHGNRRRASSAQPASTRSSSAASRSALIAATAAYRPNTPFPNPTLAAAAAGAALRHATLSPPPPEQRIGSIPTKRMLQRRDSYSSVNSDPPSPNSPRPELMRRRSSSGSLTDRRFRKERSAPPPLTRGHITEGEDDGPHYMQSTLRQKPAPPRNVKTPEPAGSVLSRGSLRGSAPSRTRSSGSESSAGRRRVYPGRSSEGTHEDSVTSFSSLDSIEERSSRSTGLDASIYAPRRTHMRSPTPVAEEDVPLESREEEEREIARIQEAKARVELLEAQRRHRQITLAKLQTQSKSPPPTRVKSPEPSSPRLQPPASNRTSVSPTRTHFSSTTMEVTKHSPPPRSVSPAKSALKHTPSSPSPIMAARKVAGDTPSSIDSRRKSSARVSFSDEESIVSFSNSRPPLFPPDHHLADRPDLPVFSSVKHSIRNEEMKNVRQRGPKAEPTQEEVIMPRGSLEPLPPEVTSISPPPSDSELSSDEDELTVMKSRSARMNIPQFHLIQATPQEEKEEPKAMQPPAEIPKASLPTPPPEPVMATPQHNASMLSNEVPGSFPDTPPETLKEPSYPTTSTAIDDDDASSDSDSIYSDAFETLPSAPPAAAPALPSIAEALDTTPTRPAAPAPSARTSPSSSSSPLRPPSPPLPPDFAQTRKIPQRTRSGTPPPPSKPSTRRQRRQSSPNAPQQETKMAFRASMRTPGHRLPPMRRRYSSDSDDGERGGMFKSKTKKVTVAAAGAPWKSRFADDSDDDGQPARRGMARRESSAEVTPTTSPQQHKTLRKKSTAAEQRPRTPVQRARTPVERPVTPAPLKKKGGFWKFGKKAKHIPVAAAATVVEAVAADVGVEPTRTKPKKKGWKRLLGK